MLKLTIKKQNGEIYWVECFDDKESLKKWLDEEKSRPYWEKSFEVEIEDKTEEVKQAAEALKIKQENEKNKLKDLKKSLKDFKNKENKKVEDCLKAIQALVEYLGLDDA